MRRAKRKFPAGRLVDAKCRVVWRTLTALGNGVLRGCGEEGEEGERPRDAALLQKGLRWTLDAAKGTTLDAGRWTVDKRRLCTLRRLASRGDWARRVQTQPTAAAWSPQLSCMQR